jgi:predicted membrane channel-forming protein YqfA (hemolysin III family)
MIEDWRLFVCTSAGLCSRYKLGAGAISFTSVGVAVAGVIMPLRFGYHMQNLEISVFWVIMGNSMLFPM